MKRTHPDRRSPLAALALLTLATTVSLPATAQEEPTVDQILQRHVEALGGEEAIAGLRSLKKNGTLAYNGLEHPLTVYQQRPDKVRFEMEGLVRWAPEVALDRTQIRAYDGESAWWLGASDSTAPEAAEDFVAAELVEASDLDGPLVAPSESANVELVGRDELEGTEVFHLLVRPAEGRTQHWYLDAESYLPVAHRVELAQQNPEAGQLWVYDDWREVDGVMVPFYVMVEELLFSREYLYDSIEANVEIDDAIFTLPAN